MHRVLKAIRGAGQAREVERVLRESRFRDEIKKTPQFEGMVFSAAMSEDLPTLRALVRGAGYDLNAPAFGQYPLLAQIVALGPVSSLEEMLELGVDVPKVEALCDALLLFACERSSQAVEAAHLLLAHGADPWLYEDPPPICAAFRLEEVDLLELLLQASPVAKLAPPLFAALVALESTTPRVPDQDQVGLRSAVALLLPCCDLEFRFGDLDQTLLHWAAVEGRLEVVGLICSVRAELASFGDLNGNTPLHLACNSGRLDVARILLEHGALVNAPNKGNETPLFSAIWGCHPEAVDWLLERGADVSVMMTNNGTPLHIAAQKMLPGVVEMLLHAGADLGAANTHRESPLHFAIKHIECLELAICSGADVSKRNSYGYTALHTACEGWGRDHEESVDHLLFLGADPYALLDSGDSTLNIAADRTDSAGILETLLHLGVSSGISQCLRSVCSKALGIRSLELLLSSGADVSSDPSCLTLSCYGDPSKPLFLLSLPGIISHIDWTPEECPALYVACFEGHLELVRSLLNFGAIVNRRGLDGNTPAHVACAKGFLDILELLVDAGADLTIPNDRHHAPPCLLGTDESLSLARLVIERGASSKVLEECGRLLASHQHDAAGIIRLLLDDGVDFRLAAPQRDAVSLSFHNDSDTFCVPDWLLGCDTGKQN